MTTDTSTALLWHCGALTLTPEVGVHLCPGLIAAARRHTPTGPYRVRAKRVPAPVFMPEGERAWHRSALGPRGHGRGRRSGRRRLRIEGRQRKHGGPDGHRRRRVKTGVNQRSPIHRRPEALLDGDRSGKGHSRPVATNSARGGDLCARSVWGSHARMGWDGGWVSCGNKRDHVDDSDNAKDNHYRGRLAVKEKTHTHTISRNIHKQPHKHQHPVSEATEGRTGHVILPSRNPTPYPLPPPPQPLLGRRREEQLIPSPASGWEPKVSIGVGVVEGEENERE